MFITFFFILIEVHFLKASDLEIVLELWQIINLHAHISFFKGLYLFSTEPSRAKMKPDLNSFKFAVIFAVM